MVRSVHHSGGFGIFVTLLNKWPVDAFHELFDKLGAVIAIINIIGMFPNVNGENGGFPMSDWIAGIGERE